MIADRAVVAGCEYDVGRRGQGTPVPEEARMLAARVAAEDWQAAPLYVVDVGDCDARAVVAAATRVALRRHG